jgi:hypothetical protein
MDLRGGSIRYDFFSLSNCTIQLRYWGFGMEAHLGLGTLKIIAISGVLFFLIFALNSVNKGFPSNKSKILTKRRNLRSRSSQKYGQRRKFQRAMQRAYHPPPPGGKSNNV